LYLIFFTTSTKFVKKIIEISETKNFFSCAVSYLMWEQLIQESQARPLDCDKIKHLIEQLALTDTILQLQLCHPRSTRPRSLQSLLSNPNFSWSHTLCETKEASLTLFCLPAEKSLPLHDHPGMTVLCKVLYGSLSHHSFDWIHEDELQAKKVAADSIPTGKCHHIRPDGGGTLHTFAPDSSCKVVLFLDFITPPYDDEESRTCTFFKHIADCGTIIEEAKIGQELILVEDDDPEFELVTLLAPRPIAKRIRENAPGPTSEVMGKELIKE